MKFVQFVLLPLLSLIDVSAGNMIGWHKRQLVVQKRREEDAAVSMLLSRYTG